MRKYTDEEFVAAWREHGSSPSRVAAALQMTAASLMRRRARMAERGIVLPTIPLHGHLRGANRYGEGGWQAPLIPFKERLDYTATDGYAVFFGDCHWWPGEPSLAHLALLKVCKLIKPKLVCANGDVFDGATISRHDPLGWTKLPTVVQELDIVKTRLGEIERASQNAQRYLSPGNHCTRFDRRLASEAAEFEGVQGFRIEDHLKGWPMAYVGVINADAEVPVLVMHNFKGGVHATWNNAVHAGATIVTGHLHSQDRKAHTTYFRTCYGVDHGMLADPSHAAFSYTMGRPKNWRSGFAVMRFDSEGRHMPPEFLEVQVYKNLKRAVWRGEVICEEAVERPAGDRLVRHSLPVLRNAPKNRGADARGASR